MEPLLGGCHCPPASCWALPWLYQIKCQESKLEKKMRDLHVPAILRTTSFLSLSLHHLHTHIHVIQNIQLINKYVYVSYRVFNCILVHFIPLPVFIFYSFTGIYILLILFLYSILSTLFPCTLYGLIFPFLFLYFYSIFVYSFSLFSVPAWMGLYRRGRDYTAWSVFV